MNQAPGASCGILYYPGLVSCPFYAIPIYPIYGGGGGGNRARKHARKLPQNVVIAYYSNLSATFVSILSVKAWERG